MFARVSIIFVALCCLAHAVESNTPDRWTLKLWPSREHTGNEMFPLGNAFTIDAYIRFERGLDALPDEGALIFQGKSSTQPGGFALRLRKSGLLTWEENQQIRCAGAVPAKGPHRFAPGEWTHVSVVSWGGKMQLYWTLPDEKPGWAHLVGEADTRCNLAQVSGFAVAKDLPAEVREVRISTIARDATDFSFIPEPARKKPGVAFTPVFAVENLELVLNEVKVDGETHSASEDLQLSAGLHNLDFDFAVPFGATSYPIRVRSRLKGFEDDWVTTDLGMCLTVEVLNAQGHVISAVRHVMQGQSTGWKNAKPAFLNHSEPLYVPENASELRISLSSGAPDTIGQCLVRELRLIGNAGKPIVTGELTLAPDTTDASPAGWQRAGSSPAIARITSTDGKPALALDDVDDSANGIWQHSEPLTPHKGGATYLLHWDEAYDVKPGRQHRSTFTNVPPGSYTFEAVAVSLHEPHGQATLSLPVTIAKPVTENPWFWSIIATCIIGSLAVGFVAVWRQIAARKLAVLRLQNAIGEDRARIARDMHDDLGTRITLLTMNASLAQRGSEQLPEENRKHLGNLAVSSRELVAAMDDLVWAVDPANDSLEDLGEHLGAMAHEIFSNSEVHCTVDIPLQLPERELRSDFRHHVMLCAKEAMHNVLRHAGPCETILSLRIEGEKLQIDIQDHGIGFDNTTAGKGNGLGNYQRRMQLVGGTANVNSTPGKGTKVSLRCPLPPATQ